MPSGTTNGDSNGHANGHTNGSSKSSSHGLDLTVLGLNSGTSMVVMPFIHEASENLTNFRMA
jgi:hypothetical protein